VLDLGDGILVEGHCDQLTNGRALPSREVEGRSSSGRGSEPGTARNVRSSETRGRTNRRTLVHKRHSRSGFETWSARRWRTLRWRERETVEKLTMRESECEGRSVRSAFKCLQREGFSLCGGCVDQSNPTPRPTREPFCHHGKNPSNLRYCTRGSSDCRA